MNVQKTLKMLGNVVWWGIGIALFCAFVVGLAAVFPGFEIAFGG